MKLVDTWELYREERERRNEHNDCVVRAIASAFQISYRSSHRWCQNVLERKHRHGTFTTQGIAKNLDDPRIKRMKLYRAGITSKWYTYIRNLRNLRAQDRAERVVPDILPKGCKNLTLGRFVKEIAEPNKTYFILCKRHAIAVRDQVVYDNTNTKKMSRVQLVWEVLDEVI